MIVISSIIQFIKLKISRKKEINFANKECSLPQCSMVLYKLNLVDVICNSNKRGTIPILCLSFSLLPLSTFHISLAFISGTHTHTHTQFNAHLQQQQQATNI